MRTMLKKSIIAAAAYLGCAFMAIAGGPALAGNWPQFRGPQASGIGDGKPPTRWNVKTGRNIKWKTPIEGLAHSCPIIWENFVFLTTAVGKSGETPELTTGWEAADGHSAQDKGPWTWKLLCLDRDTGKVIWDREAHSGVPKFKRHPKASHANCTPATDGKHVVAFFGSQGLFCYDFKGKLLWRKQVGELNASPAGNPDLQWGFASSPIIYDNLVILQCDCENTDFWVALDIETGREVRRVQRQEDTTWSTPSVFDIGGRPQLVLNGYKHMGAYDLNTGEELWKLRGGGDIPVPTPLFANGLIFLASGHGGRRPIYAIRPDARGDLTPRGNSKPEGLAWWSTKGGSYIPTPIIYRNNLYVCDDGGRLTVYDAQTGKQYYRKRLAKGGANYTASAVAAGGKIYFTSEDGDVHVLKAGNKYKLLASNRMREICMATPAISDGLLFIRTRSQLYCIGK